ncbi:MAG: GLPGLI family protein [Bacteroidota bacterium]
MKLFLLLICELFISAIAIAQTPDQVLIRVRYTYINSIDTLKNGKPRIENMLLFAGKNNSLYTSYDKINFEVALDQKVRAMVLAHVDDGKPKSFKIDQSSSEWMSKLTHYYFAKENKFFVKEKVAFQDYFFQEENASLKWKITTDTLSFSGIKCRKAIGTYKGKNWTAWFAPSLPFQSGPWKLNSLPGLIIEAFDENKETYFQFAGLENAKEGDFVRTHDITKGPNAEPGFINTVDVMMGIDIASAYFTNFIQLPTYVVKTTKAQVEKLKAAYKKDPKGFEKIQAKF